MLAAPALVVLSKVWKPVAIVAAVGAAWWAVTTWRDNLIAAAENRGFARAEQQFTVKVEAANAIATHDTNQMQLFAGMIGGLTAQRAQAIDLKIVPQTERIQNEVASDPRYRDCRVSDRVLDAANAARATVDAGIAASNPK